jgi:hypothetical protein
MKKLFQRGKLLVGTTMLAAALVSGCGDSDNFVFTNNNGNAVGAPIAVDDAFNALGNATLNQAAATGVLANDTVNGATINGFDAVGSQGGAINLNADGSFTYTPVIGFVGAETFTYTLNNAIGNSTATVTLTSTGFGRFVDNTAGAGGTGTQVDPFDTLLAGVNAAQAGDTVFVARGDGTNTGLTGGVNLPVGVNLVGEGSGLILGQTIVAPGLAPVIAGPIACLGNNIVRGVTVDGSPSELILASGVTGDVTIDQCTLINPTDDNFLASDVGGTITITNCSFDRPGASNDMICIDNNSVNATVVITDNNFANSTNVDFDSCTELDSSGTMTMDVTYSRNNHNGTVANPVHYGFYWDSEDEPNVTATLTCTDNVFTNGVDEAISTYDVSGTISGNMVTDNTDEGYYGSVTNETLTISGNTFTNIACGVSMYFNDNAGAGTFIVDNNNIANATDDGIYAEEDENNTAKIAIRNNTVNGSANEAVDIDWDATSDICLEVVGNTVNRDMLFDSDGGGTMNIERRDQLGTINTVNAPGMVDIQDGTANVAQGFCAIP